MIDRLCDDMQRMHVTLRELKDENERLASALREILAQGETLRLMGPSAYEQHAGFTLETVIVLARQAL